MGTVGKKVIYSSITITSLIFLAWLFLRVLPSVGSHPGGPLLKNLSEMNNLSHAIKSYYTEYGMLQTNREALEKYMGRQVRFTDYWGNPYHFKVSPDTQWIEITSYAPTGLTSKYSKHFVDLVVTQILKEPVGGREVGLENKE